MRLEINYVGDYKDNTPDKTLMVESDRDYVEACNAIISSVKTQNDVVIWVRNKSHLAWFKSFDGIANLLADFSEKTPLTILADLWHVAVPDWLSDQTVISQRLLDLTRPGVNVSHFEDAMMFHFFGSAPASATLGTDNLSRVISSITDTETKGHFDRYPILNKCLEEKCKSWSLSTDQQWIKEICQLIPTDLEGLWKDICLWRLLYHYPKKSLDYAVSPDRAVILRKVPLEALGGITLNDVAVEQALTQIDLFFKDVSSTVKSAEDFIKVLNCSSGLLRQEFLFLEKVLGSRQFEVTSSEVDAMRVKYKNCPGVDMAKLVDLDRFIVPLRPVTTENLHEWAAERWIRWAIKEYIPYRKWQVRNCKYEEEVEKMVQAFSEWYISEYVTIHQDADMSLVHALGKRSNAIKLENMSIIVLVDCMPYSYWYLLVDAFKKAGFYKHDETCCFAPLPAVTEICKPMLISGKWADVGKDYSSIFNARSHEEWDDKKTFYVSNIKSLNELELPDEPFALLVNFLQADEVLHSDVESYGISYEEELLRLFERVAHTVKSVVDRTQGTPQECSVYVLTDHGATKIIDAEKKSFESKVVNKLFANEKHRFAVLNGIEAQQIPDNLWELGYKFKQQFSGDGVDYFIPRGHNTVKTAAYVKGFVHGGATPEEILVPVGLFKQTSVKWKNLVSRITSPAPDSNTGIVVVYVMRIVVLNIEIANPNAETVKVTRVDIISPVAEIKNQTLPLIDKSGSSNILIDCYFNKKALNETELIVIVHYEIGGEERTHEIQIKAEFKSAVTGGFSLKDLK